MRIRVGLLLAAAILVRSAGAQAPAKRCRSITSTQRAARRRCSSHHRGESLLVDVGNPGGRDTDRIMLALEDAGVKQIDHLVLTHHHGDHVGGRVHLG